MEAGTPTRTDARRRRARRRAIVVAVVVLVVALGAGVALTSCSGGGSDDASKTTTTSAPKTTVDIPLGNVSADSAGAAATVSADQSQHVLDALTTYVKGATVQPLRRAPGGTAAVGGVVPPMLARTRQRAG